MRILDEAGIPREGIMAVDREKVDDALEVTDLSESDVSEIEECEYVRNADVDEARKATSLHGLKDKPALSDDPGTADLRQEVAALEQRIADLAEFKPGPDVGTRS